MKTRTSPLKYNPKIGEGCNRINLLCNGVQQYLPSRYTIWFDDDVAMKAACATISFSYWYFIASRTLIVIYVGFIRMLL